MLPVYFLHELDVSHESEVGKKALLLGRLLKKHDELQPGFVIGKSVHTHLISTPHVQSLLQRYHRTGDESIREEAYKIVMNAQYPSDLQLAIIEAYHSLAIHDDMDANSLLAQKEIKVYVRAQDTLSVVQGSKALLKSVLHIYALYDQPVSIIITPFVQPRASGTASITEHAITIKARFGITENDKRPSDAYMVNEQNLLITQMNIAQKDYDLTLKNNALEKITLGNLSTSQVINQREISLLARRVKQIAHMLKSHTQIYWYLANDRLYFESVEPGDPMEYFDFTNVDEQVKKEQKKQEEQSRVQNTVLPQAPPITPVQPSMPVQPPLQPEPYAPTQPISPAQPVPSSIPTQFAAEQNDDEYIEIVDLARPVEEKTASLLDNLTFDEVSEPQAAETESLSNEPIMQAPIQAPHVPDNTMHQNTNSAVEYNMYGPAKTESTAEHPENPLRSTIQSSMQPQATSKQPRYKEIAQHSAGQLLVHCYAAVLHDLQSKAKVHLGKTISNMPQLVEELKHIINLDETALHQLYEAHDQYVHHLGYPQADDVALALRLLNDE